MGEKWKIPTIELSAILWDSANFQILVFMKHLCNVDEKWKITTIELGAILSDLADFQILVFMKHLI